MLTLTRYCKFVKGFWKFDMETDGYLWLVVLVLVLALALVCFVLLSNR